MKKKILSVIMTLAMVSMMIVIPAQAGTTAPTYNYLDISSKLNKDMIAKNGQTVQNTWHTGYYATYAEGWTNQDSKNSIVTTKYENGIKYITKGSYTDLVAKTYTYSGELVPFSVPAARFEAGTKDAIEFATTGDTVTVDAGDNIVDNLYILWDVSVNGGPQIEFTINYEDGTADVINDLYLTLAYRYTDSARPNNYYCVGSMERYKYAVGVLPRNDAGMGKRNNATDNGDGTYTVATTSNTVESGFVIYQIPVDEEKKVASYKMESKSGSDSAIYAMTEELASVAAMRTYITTVEAYDVVTESNVNEVLTAKMYADEIVARNAGTAGEFSAIYALASQILTLNGTLYRYDKDTVQYKGEFTETVNENSIAGKIAVTSDNVPVTGISYILADDDKTLTVDIPADMSGGKTIKVVIDDVELRDYPGKTMLKAATTTEVIPEYLTTTYNGTKLTIENNSKVNQEYLAIVGKYDGDATTAYLLDEDTVNPGPEKEVILDTTSAAGTAYAVVLDKTTFKPLSTVGTIYKTTAQTDATADYTKATLDLVTNKVKIHGNVTPAAEDRIVAVTIYNPTNTNLLYAGAVKTNADGYFVIDAAIDTLNIGTSGYLKIKIGGEDISTPVEINDVYYPLKSEQIQMVNDLRGAANATAIEPMLTTAVQLLSMNLTPYVALVGDAASLTKLATRVNAIKAEIPEITVGDPEADEKISQAQNILKVQAILECIQEGEGTLIATNGALLYNDIMKYSSIDDAPGVTLYNLYTNEINATGKTEIVNSLLNKNYPTTTALYNDLEKAIMLSAIKYPAKKGIGHIEKALTEKNAEAAEMTITKYLTLTDTTQVDSAIANMQISTLADVENYIANLKAPTGVAPTSPKPSGNGGGGGFVAITPSVPAVQPETPATPEVNEPVQDNTQDNENAGTTGSFGDVETSHWAYDAIEYLSNMGIINGKGNDEFLPDDTITRAEFVKILCLAMDIPVSDVESIFGDVDDSAWFAPFVMAAYEAGIINGIGENIFGAENNISRQDLCTLLYRLVGAEFTGTTEFADSDDIADYAKEAVAYAFEEGFIKGFPDNTFKPEENCTRAQAAAIIYNFLGIEEN